MTLWNPHLEKWYEGRLPADVFFRILQAYGGL